MRKENRRFKKREREEKQGPGNNIKDIETPSIDKNLTSVKWKEIPSIYKRLERKQSGEKGLLI